MHTAISQAQHDNDCERAIGTETLYRSHAPFVAACLRRLGATGADVDDLIQDVFVTALSKGGYRPGAAAPRTWLFSLALQMLVTLRRSRARAQRLCPVACNHTADSSGPAELFEMRCLLERVQVSLAEMSCEQRALFISSELQGESCEHLAAVWKVPVGTIYSRLHSARKRFVDGVAADSSHRGWNTHEPRSPRHDGAIHG